MMLAMKTVTMVMCLFAVLHLVSSQDMDMDELPGFEKIVEVSPCYFWSKLESFVTIDRFDYIKTEKKLLDEYNTHIIYNCCFFFYICNWAFLF